MLTSKIDDDWLVGYLESNVMHQGLFPSGFVEIIIPLKEQVHIRHWFTMITICLVNTSPLV